MYENISSLTQPSQNVPAASHLATYNEISAAHFTLVRLVFRPEALAVSASAAYYYSQLAYYSKTFDWAANIYMYIVGIRRTR